MIFSMVQQGLMKGLSKVKSFYMSRAGSGQSLAVATSVVGTSAIFYRFLFRFQQKENFDENTKNWSWEWFMIKVDGFLLPFYSFYPSDDDPSIWTLTFF